MIKEFIQKEDLCQDCKKRKATKLCDCINGKFFDLIVKGEIENSTCDRKICNECATKIMYNLDICNICKDNIKKQLT